MSRTAFHLVASSLALNILIGASCAAFTAYNVCYRIPANQELLREHLRTMRKAIDQYTADREYAPLSLAALADEHYLSEIPVDPMTGARDWEVVVDDIPLSSSRPPGIKDVRSSSKEMDWAGRRSYANY